MPGFEKVRKNLEAHGFDVTCFDTAAEAADYLDRRLDGKTVGHGGSITLKELGLLERLQSHAVVRSHWLGDSFADAAAAPGLSDLGQRPGGDRRAHNLDGTGNRVASTISAMRGLLYRGRQQAGSRLRRRPLAGPQRGLPQKRPAAGQKDSLRRPGGQML